MRATIDNLFPDLPIDTSDAVAIEGPEITDDGAHVPVRLRLGTQRDTPHRIALVASANPHPLVATLDLGERFSGPLALRIKLARSQSVILLAATGQRLYAATTFLKIVASGCNPGQDETPPTDLGTIRFRHDPPREGMADARLLIRHPMRVEQRDASDIVSRPANHITMINVDIDGNPLLGMACGQSVAADPYLAFRLRTPQAGETLEIGWRDTQGRGGDARFPLGI
ncbi:MAG: thiosulfate oxidation carrier complex protein SoxZ [Rhodocyclaceae bacterium]|nr:thiosulfate oxidation carrier complex protein SoxZ [Rhodocyclaceae bacterium]